MKETKERGITLIVLIITIIIMLILATVMISITLGENGIIQKAKDAKEQTQMEADRERLLEVVMGCMDLDKRVVFTGENGLDNNLPEGFIGSNGIYTKRGYQFTVNESGIITVEKIGTGGTDIPPEEGEGILPAMECIEAYPGLVGSIVTINDIEYMVMSKDLENGTVDLISNEDLGSVTLGYEDEDAIENAIDLDGNGTISNAEIAIYSYNNAIEKLVMACVEESGVEIVDGTNIISIRCPGNNDIKYTSEGLVGSDEPGYFSNTNIKSADDNYLTDMEILIDMYDNYYYDALGNYWLASRIYKERADDYFGIRNCMTDIEDADYECVGLVTYYKRSNL